METGYKRCSDKFNDSVVESTRIRKKLLEILRGNCGLFKLFNIWEPVGNLTGIHQNFDQQCCKRRELVLLTSIESCRRLLDLLNGFPFA